MPFVPNFFFLRVAKKLGIYFCLMILYLLHINPIQDRFFNLRFTIQQYSVPVHVSESCEDRSNNKNHLFPDVDTFDDGFVFKFEVPSFIAPLLLLGQLGNVRAGSVARFS